MPIETYCHEAGQYLNQAKHPTLARTMSVCAYRPMVELRLRVAFVVHWFCRYPAAGSLKSIGPSRNRHHPGTKAVSESLRRSLRVSGQARSAASDRGKSSPPARTSRCALAWGHRVPDPALVLMAKFGVIVSEWMTSLDLDATAIQCWSSLQKNYGVNCCTIMSMMSEKLMPSACEVDIAGTVAMYALQLASGRPSALVDWNNNYGDDPDRCVFFHCGNWAKAFLPDITIATAPILGTTLGEKNTYGALAGRTPQGPVTFGRVSTDDREGRIRAYVGQGEFTDDPLKTFGTRAVVRVPELQKLMRFICRNGFEHHAAMNASHSAGILAEAMDTYLGWDVHRHN